MMSSMWGKNIKISLFGESHGKAIGVTIDGVKAGFEIDVFELKKFMNRRISKNTKISTSRQEQDEFEFISGIFNGKTNGAPICAMIKNKYINSKNYEELKDIARPSHADFTGFIKYNGYNDFRGGGHFSGRLTAPLVLAGGICVQVLNNLNIYLSSHINSIKDIKDDKFDFENINIETFENLNSQEFPLLNQEKKILMEQEIYNAKQKLDSVGGTIETCVINLPVGLGNPIFENVESKISSMIFAIPSVKGVEFGEGFNSTKLFGSENNDEFEIIEKKIKTKTNNSGGILGGITSGMPLIVKTAIKPTPSIGKSQQTINLKTNQQTNIEIKGRHDPCIVPRAVVCVEAGIAISILDLIYDGGIYEFRSV